MVRAPAERQHLLLAAGQGAGQLLAALAEAREAGVGDLLELGRRRLAPAGERVHQDVLADREVREHAAALGDEAHAGLGEAVDRGAGDVVALHQHRARASGRSAPLMTLSSVVLPAPFGPSMARIEPPGTTRSTPCSTSIVP